MWKKWKLNGKKQLNKTFLLEWNKKIYQCWIISLGINNGGWFEGALGHKHMWSKRGFTKRHPQIGGQWQGQWLYLISKFIFLQFSFAIKLQLHTTHGTIFFLNHIRQVACDISLHATYYTYDVHTMYIWYVCTFHQFIFVQQIVCWTTCVTKWKYFLMICVHFQANHLMTCMT